MHSIFAVTTGGTIDAEAYPVIDGEVRPPRDAYLPPESAVRAYLQTKPGCRIDQTLAIAKDSKDITKAQLQAIADAILAAPEQHILISMGTDHLSQHGVRLRALLRNASKRVVMVASHVPLANGEISDGIRNLDTALTHLETMAPGVDVVIPRSLASLEKVECWPAGTMFKDLATRSFVPAEGFQEDDTPGTHLAARNG